MRFSKWGWFAFFISCSSHAIEFDLRPGNNDADGMIYYNLHVKGNNKESIVDVALEGNANQAVIREKLSFICPWGLAEGVRLDMTSSDVNGMLTVNNIYFFDKNLSIVAAKSYSKFDNNWVLPESLKNSVCTRSGNSLGKEEISGKDYIVDSEVIFQGPFQLPEVKNTTIKYIFEKKLKLVKENESGESVIDEYDNIDGVAPEIKTVFFLKVSSQMNIVSLISWGDGINTFFKVYAYKYDENGVAISNDMINNDPNLSGSDRKGISFKYKNAASIRKYIVSEGGDEKKTLQ